MAANDKDAVLKDVLPDALCADIVSFFGQSVQFSEDDSHFDKTYKKLNSGSKAPVKSGYFGGVYKVRHIDTGVVYAIKEIQIVRKKASVYNTGKECRQLVIKVLQELVLIGKIQHANIVRGHAKLNWAVLPDTEAADVPLELGEKGPLLPLSELDKLMGTKFYIVMDWYSEDLSDVYKCKTSPGVEINVPSLNETTSLLVQVLLGLRHLHEEEEYVHDDVKPENLMKGDGAFGNVALVGDLGAMIPITDQPIERTRVGKTPFYAPDEFATANVDIWSFGMVMFTFLYHSANNAVASQELLKQVRGMAGSGDVAGLRLHVRELLPKDQVEDMLVEVVVQCLLGEPDERPAAAVITEVLTNTTEYQRARAIAREFYDMMPSGNSVICEEMVFPRWYERVLLPLILSSPSAERFTSVANSLDALDLPLLYLDEIDRGVWNDIAKLF